MLMSIAGRPRKPQSCKPLVAFQLLSQPDVKNNVYSFPQRTASPALVVLGCWDSLTYNLINKANILL
ncbi:unnamed protein product [Arctogadus glacialis]